MALHSQWGYGQGVNGVFSAVGHGERFAVFGLPFPTQVDLMTPACHFWMDVQLWAVPWPGLQPEIGL